MDLRRQMGPLNMTRSRIVLACCFSAAVATGLACASRGAPVLPLASAEPVFEGFSLRLVRATDNAREVAAEAVLDVVETDWVILPVPGSSAEFTAEPAPGTSRAALPGLQQAWEHAYELQVSRAEQN